MICHIFLLFLFMPLSSVECIAVKETHEFKRKFGDILEKLRESWTISKSWPRIEFTRLQAEYFRNLSTPVDPETGLLIEDFEDFDLREDRKGKRDTRKELLDAVSRQKRQTCDTIPNAKRKKKEWRQLRPSHRQQYINALEALDAFIPDPGDPSTSAFDLFVIMHRFANSPGAHAGASFLPWHREYLWRFAVALIQQGYKKPIPYIDSALDQTLPNPMDSALFTTSFRGVGTHDGNLGAPWNNDITTPHPSCGSAVTRGVPSATAAQAFAYSRAKYSIILGKASFRDLTEGWDFDMEMFHNVGHVFFGGTMNSITCSPSDPVFWMHHGNVDCLWEEFRQTVQTTSERTVEYPMTQLGAEPDDMRWNSIMQPFDDWGLYNIHGLSNHYRNYYYRCEDRPSSISCSSTTDCVSASIDSNPMLWCETSTNRCHAKIRVGGQCSPSWPHEQCWCETGTPACTGSVCFCN